MIKQTNRRDGLREARLLRGLSHPNIVQLHEVFMQDDEVYMELDYCRLTLEEVVNVHIRFEELHLRLIAHSLFAAIRHISAHRIVHGNVKLESTRICGKTMVIKLTNFEDAKPFEDAMPNSDLEQLGLLILQCMDGRNAGNHADVGRVRQHRALNKVFGLTEPERWSGAKQLMDFLDDLFNREKCAETKITKPVSPSGASFGAPY
ncbi:hypothetical protein GQ43DRAFT_443825 [Neofusicoccum parvum]|uniref:Uncharacterized protein n=1 Tax=Neofusicoccum parvum TaxID=310453 RepID=A0ACB5SCF6_9PEZI|nr:hypothetical protein GQ43DRAFT_443825 [Neofusicoccum parvum]